MLLKRTSQQGEIELPPELAKLKSESDFDVSVAPYFDYCSEVWGYMGKGLCDRLQRLHYHRAGRIITFSDYTTRSVDFLDLIWDTLEQRRAKQLAISVFKSLNNLYPESLKNMFKPTSGVHSYNVRGASNNIFVPRPRTEAAKRAFRYRGAVMWNGLENVLKTR